MKQATFLFQNLLIITLIAITITKGDQYRSNGSGLWISTSVWQKSTDGGATYSASSTIPGNSNTDTALIRNTHTITINTNFTNDQHEFYYCEIDCGPGVKRHSHV